MPVIKPLLFPYLLKNYPINAFIKEIIYLLISILLFIKNFVTKIMCLEETLQCSVCSFLNEVLSPSRGQKLVLGGCLKNILQYCNGFWPSKA